MYCPQCGTYNPENARFCSNCGKALTDGVSAPAMGTGSSGQPANGGSGQPAYGNSGQPANGNPSYSGGRQPKKPSFFDQIPTFAKILIPLLAVIALVLIIILIAGGSKNKKDQQTADGNTSAVSSVNTAGTPDGSGGNASDSTGNPAGGNGTGEAVPSEPGVATAEITDETGAVTVVTVEALPRPSFLTGLRFLTTTQAADAVVPNYTIASDFSNVINAADMYLDDKEKQKLLENYFFIMARSGGHEFFETYEMNRYQKRPNFVTTDSMMHVYHLYFSKLLKNTERNYLSAALSQLVAGMAERSAAQLETLRGTEWENSAVINTAFFAVGASLLEVPVSVPDDVNAIVQQELSLISQTAGVMNSPLLNYDSPDNPNMLDYSQYIVRGYYEGDAQLEKYFRAMMWFGQVNFAQNSDTLDRSALLMTLCLDDETLPLWEAIYSVTSFFAGAMDDLGYYEYRPVIDAVYGASCTAADLPGNDAAFAQFHTLTAAMEPPKINSVPVMDDGYDTDHVAENKGFRFMGQRFSLDATIFQNLLYNRVQANPSGEDRRLPDALDIPAALGSDTALSILDSRGETAYAGYSENMSELRTAVLNAPDDLWNASLYSKWLFTLRPLLAEKTEGYPPFMQNNAWTRKNLQTFLGSYAELKHDTVLYSKQVMVEMGGDDFGEKDDRGYVEPEPELFGRLADLTQATMNGLSAYGLLSEEDQENLSLLASLADQLRVIAEKELRSELPTDEEFELIRSFGGQLEHFWEEVYKDETDQSYISSRDFPAAIVTDVATDPNGICKELGTGQTGEIFVVVPVDGTLRIATGTVYSFYQFEHPISDRLTDSKWRVLIGAEMNDEGRYNNPAYELEDWTRDFQLTWEDLQ